MKKKMKWE